MKIANIDFSGDKFTSTMIDGASVLAGAALGAFLLKGMDKLITVPAVSGFFGDIDDMMGLGKVTMGKKSADFVKAGVVTIGGVALSIVGVHKKNRYLKLAGLGAIVTGVNEGLQKLVLKRSLLNGLDLGNVQDVDYSEFGEYSDGSEYLHLVKFNENNTNGFSSLGIDPDDYLIPLPDVA